jgi:hypothetical protein
MQGWANEGFGDVGAFFSGFFLKQILRVQHPPQPFPQLQQQHQEEDDDEENQSQQADKKLLQRQGTCSIRSCLKGAERTSVYINLPPTASIQL